MNALEISNLRKTYTNDVDVVALKGVDLTVKQGDFFALLGPNGAGKTTMIGIIASLVNKTSGSVKVFGSDLDTQISQVKSSIGLVPQEFNFNIFEKVINVVVTQAGFYGIEREQALVQAEKYLRRLDLWEKRNSKARDLSGGMKRRLMIARALVHEPKMLILDEPTAGVDLSIRRSMWHYLTEINEQGTTIILTTHYLEEAERLCRNVAIIDHGEIIVNTNVQKLLSTLAVESFELFSNEPFVGELTLPSYYVKKMDDYSIQVDVTGEQTLNGLFAELSKTPFQVSSMRNKQNRLEELFIQLTGTADEKK